MGGFRDMLDTLRRGTSDPIAHVRLPDAQVLTGDGAGSTATGGDCFVVTVNGMRLQYDRRYNRTYDPMVLAVSEFLYDGAVRSVPFVVGASMVANAAQGTPQGMRFTGTRVAGPHPYHGQLALTVILYRVLRDDYVRSALGAVQKICTAVGAGPVSTALEIGEGVLDAVDAALGHGQVEPALGFRTEHHDTRPATGTFALLSEPVEPDALWLAGGELSTGSPGDPRPAPADQVTYTISSAPPAELDSMAWFPPLWRRIVQWANIPDDAAKEVTKNHLGALYEEIATSPDIPRDAVEGVYSSWEARAMGIHTRARERAAWGPDELRRDPVRARSLEIRAAR